jgi:hypothetical protein
MRAHRRTAWKRLWARQFAKSAEDLPQREMANGYYCEARYNLLVGAMLGAVATAIRYPSFYELGFRAYMLHVLHLCCARSTAVALSAMITSGLGILFYTPL